MTWNSLLLGKSPLVLRWPMPEKGGASVINCLCGRIAQGRLMLPRGVGRCKCLPRRSFHLGSWGGKCTPGRGVTVQMFISEAGSLANNKCPHMAVDGERGFAWQITGVLMWPWMGKGFCLFVLRNCSPCWHHPVGVCEGADVPCFASCPHVLPCVLPLPVASPSALSLEVDY